MSEEGRIPDITDVLSVYRIDDSETHWVIGEDEDDALQSYAEHYGFSGIDSAERNLGRSEYAG